MSIDYMRVAETKRTRSPYAAGGEQAGGLQANLNDTAEQVAKARQAQHRRTLWTRFTNIILGFWLAASPALWDYRSQELVWNDLISGALLIAFATLSLWLRFDWARWGVCGVGLWLLFAPLVFWSPTAATYNNETLVGTLAIAMSVLVPVIPSRAHFKVMMLPGSEIPAGWSYNPSTWWQRGPIIALAFVGFLLSRYLSAYQLGHVENVWDPVFGDGTRRVLESEVSRAWPVSDAGLGAVSYLLEFLSGFIGRTNRWRTMPWMVALFGLLVVPLGVTSIVLIILQPVAVGAWCFLCLVTAASMLIMISPALDEVIASLQFLSQSRREGQPLWRTFWVGGTLNDDSPERDGDQLRTQKQEILSAFDWDAIPWNLAVCAALGAWVMASPPVLGTAGAAANSSHVTGALVVTVAVIAIGQIARAARWLNLPLGAWIIIAPLLLDGYTTAAQWHDGVAGAAVLALSIRRGPIFERFGGWERAIY
jgi:hypothetical protein